MENDNILDYLLDYVKTIYEEEKQRTAYIEKKVNILSFLLGGGVLGTLLKFPENMFNNLFSRNLTFGYVSITLLFLGLLFFLMSVIYILLVYKVRIFERLCNPKDISLTAASIKKDSSIKSLILADYVVASNRNFIVNDKKAKYLSYAIYFFFGGLFFFFVSLIVINSFYII